MLTKQFKAILKNAALLLAILPFAAAAAFGQQTINLTAGPTTTTMPDGTTVPMWGYSCGTAVTGSTATCAALNPAAATAGKWSPVVITVPAASAGATALTINLTNNLLFTPVGTATQNGVPTSIVILGQVGGGLGQLSQRTSTTPPDHSLAQGCPTWFIADPNTPPGVPCTANDSADPRAARAIVQHRSGSGIRRLPGVAGAGSGHLSARIGHASFDSGPHGADRPAGGHHPARGDDYGRHRLSCSHHKCRRRTRGYLQCRTPAGIQRNRPGAE